MSDAANHRASRACGVPLGGEHDPVLPQRRLMLLLIEIVMCAVVYVMASFTIAIHVGRWLSQMDEGRNQ